MALAILELGNFERSGVTFGIDTGTNKYYRLKVGRSVERRNGIEWVSDLVYSTRMNVNEAGGGLLNSATEISIPPDRLAGGHAYVQLFTFKTPDGRSPAFSRVVKVPVGMDAPGDISDDEIPGLSMSTAMNMRNTFRTPRTVACRTAAEAYAYQASWTDLLGEVLKVAAPVVVKLLGSAGQSGGQTAAAGSPPPGGAAAQPDFLTTLLNAVLGGLQTVAAQSPSGQTPTQTQTPAQNQPPAQNQNQASQAPVRSQSVGPVVAANRFINGHGHHGDFSRPFIFGIDDAAIATLLGPFIQILPQLMNSANQKRVQMKQANNKLISDILSGINQRLLMDKLLEAQRQTPAAAGSPDLNQVIQLLQQAGTAPGGADATASAQSLPWTSTQSVSFVSPRSFVLSSKAVLSFVTGEPVKWNGASMLLFSKSQAVQFNVKFNVGEPVPQRPLTKAILKLTFKDGADQTVWLEKSVRQQDVAANSTISVALSPEEAARLPVNRKVAVLAELRWPGKAGGAAHQAFGACDVVFVNQYFLAAQGSAVSPERELADMNQYRAFWNKVWESPSLDATRGSGDDKKYLWELDINAKYSVLLAPDHDTNGLMQPKLLQAKPDPDSLTETVSGRLKGGIELAVTELNKLLPLWDAQPLDVAKLEALSTTAFAKANAGEFVRNVKMRGRAGERGIVWVIPVFKLFELTLGSSQKTDTTTGQVVAVTEETIRFPLPVSARIIGIKSQS